MQRDMKKNSPTNLAIKIQLINLPKIRGFAKIFDKVVIVVVDAVVAAVVVVVAIAVIFYDSDLIWENFIVVQKLSNSTEIFFELKNRCRKNS